MSCFKRQGSFYKCLSFFHFFLSVSVDSLLDAYFSNRLCSVEFVGSHFDVFKLSKKLLDVDVNIIS